MLDHLYQLPGLGAFDEPMLEACTLLSALAQHSEDISLGALVTDVTALGDIMATGLDGLVLKAPANVRIPGRVELLGEVAASVM